MKKILCIIVLFSNAFAAFAQSEFKTSLTEISADLSGKLSKKGKSKIVILYITDVNKANTSAGKYLADKISMNIVSNEESFQVFDRENLTEIPETAKSLSEGYISIDQAKSLGQQLSVDAIIVGTYTVLSKTIDVTLKALDASTGFVIAGASQELPLDRDAGILLGLDIAPSVRSNMEMDRGVSPTVISNEQYNNPETVNKDCEAKNNGDYCFSNKSYYPKTIVISSKPVGYNKRNGENDTAITLTPEQTYCLYELPAGVWYFYYKDSSISRANELESNCTTGQIMVEKCKSKTYEIN